MEAIPLLLRFVVAAVAVVAALEVPQFMQLEAAAVLVVVAAAQEVVR